MTSICDYDALVVVSPGGAGDERKDQDRAAWHPTSRCAVVCDGTSSSLYARAAAEQTAQFAPVLFTGDLRERLRAWADYLLLCRRGARSRPPTVDAAVPAAVQALLQDVVRAKVAQSFQTTCVAAAVTRQGDMIQADVLQVGDSAFLAFAGDGTPLWPANMSSHSSPGRVVDGQATAVRVLPGDQVLVRWPPSALSPLAPAARPERWLIGEFVTAWAATGHPRDSRGGMLLTAGDLLAVPRYLTGVLRPGSAGLWCRVTFSPALRVVPARAEPGAGSPFGARGVVTAVLPDDVATGRWHHFRRPFPMDTTFVLASDGLTRAFADAGAFWSWFSANLARLNVPAAREPAMEELHAQLRAHGGDDDISLVSVRPRLTAMGIRDQEVGHV